MHATTSTIAHGHAPHQRHAWIRWTIALLLGALLALASATSRAQTKDYQLAAGDAIRIDTPGGGGFG